MLVAIPDPRFDLRFVQILSLPASNGAVWLRDGWRLIKRQPIGLSAMVVVYTFVMFVPFSVPIPYLGLLLLGIVSPFATVGLMAAFREVAAGRLPTPSVFAEAMQDAKVRRALFKLGLIHAGLMILVTLVAGFLIGPLPAAPEQDQAGLDDIRLEKMALVALLYSPVMVAMWFAPMLTGWHRVAASKAMFGSAVACWRNKGAMAVYAVLVAGVLIGVTALGAALIGALFSNQAAPIIAAPLALALATFVQASFYPMYRSIFADAPMG